jgi:hypothetical protein
VIEAMMGRKADLRESFPENHRFGHRERRQEKRMELIEKHIILEFDY